MTTAAIHKPRTSTKTKATAEPTSEYHRDETVGRFLPVVLMPVVIAALLGVIVFYLTLPLR